MDIKLNEKNQQRVKRLMEQISNKGSESVDVSAIINEAMEWAPSLFWEDKAKRVACLYEEFQDAIKDPAQEKALRNFIDKG
jgi:hypothetical protein